MGRRGPYFQPPDHPASPHVKIMTDNEEVVCVNLSTGGNTFTGFAKRHPRDNFDYDIGYALALARAFESAAEDLKRRASDRGHNLGLGEVVRW